jgi:hypothetical protein
MKRAILIETTPAVIRLVENPHDDNTTVIIKERSPVGVSRITLAPDQLWKLAEQILAWFDAKAIRSDEQRAATDKLRERIERVLSENEARCLDDDIDRGVVARELVKGLS